MNLLLMTGFGILPSAAGRTLAEHPALLSTWSLPAVAAGIALAAAGSAAAVLRVTHPGFPQVGQLWADTSRSIRGLTIRITAVTPGHVLAVITTPPHAALHDTTGRTMDLAAGRSGLRGFRLVATERSATR